MVLVTYSADNFEFVIASKVGKVKKRREKKNLANRLQGPPFTSRTRIRHVMVRQNPVYFAFIILYLFDGPRVA